MVSAHEVESAVFGRAGLDRSGYDEVAVDDFLDRVVETLEAVEKGGDLPKGAVTSAEVVETEFPERGARDNGGYDMDDVDDLLDRVAQRLFTFECERGVAPAVIDGVPVTSDASARETHDHHDDRDHLAADTIQRVNSPRDAAPEVATVPDQPQVTSTADSSAGGREEFSARSDSAERESVGDRGTGEPSTAQSSGATRVDALDRKSVV